MDTNDNKAPVVNDVLQSDHHVHMTDEEIAKARAHHDKRHGGENEKATAADGNKGRKNAPVKPR